MRIKKTEPFIIHVPLPGSGISDSTNSITHWGFTGVILHADNGLRGYGFTGTHAFLQGDQLIAAYIQDVYGPLLTGETIGERSCIARVWKKLHGTPPLQWIGRAGISHLALAAIDIALWDLYAKQLRRPLWEILSDGYPGKKTPLLHGNNGKHGIAPELEAYNTNSGWLNIPIPQLVEGCLKSKDQGFTGVKIKVGSTDPADDIQRIEQVRKAVGEDFRLMIDGNGKWDLATALEFSAPLDACNLYWFEEPLYFDNLMDHIKLAGEMKTPIALGEQLYSKWHFDAFIQTGAVKFVQVDALRVAGISEWLEVADQANDRNLPVVAHVGDMMQVHQHTSIAHPASELLEYIPWTLHCFEDPVSVKNGRFIAPEIPGASTTIKKEALEKFGKPLR